MEGIPTRMGDGSLVRMTRAQIEADIRAGVEAGAKRAKVEPLGADEIDHLVDIFASSARFSAVDIGDEVVLTSDGVGSQDTGSRITDLQNYEQTRVHRHGRALSPRLLVQADQAGAAVRAGDHAPGAAPAHHPRRLRRDARPGALHGARRSHPQLVAAAAAGPHRRGPCGSGRGGGARPSTTSSTSPRACTRPAPTASTWTRPGRPATPTSWPPSGRSSASARGIPTGASRSAWPASSCSACTASSSTTACGWPGCGRPPR